MMKKIVRVLSIMVSFFGTAGIGLGAPDPDKPIAVRVASYNVEFGKSATPEEIGEMFKPYKLDLIGFDEVPDGDWTARVGKVLGMEHSYVGKISSANHKGKYKSILSRTLLEGTAEHEIQVQRRRCWNPASVVRAVTTKAFTYNAQDPKKNLGVIDHILYNTASGAQTHDYPGETEWPQDFTD